MTERGRPRRSCDYDEELSTAMSLLLRGKCQDALPVARDGYARWDDVREALRSRRRWQKANLESEMELVVNESRKHGVPRFQEQMIFNPEESGQIRVIRSTRKHLPTCGVDPDLLEQDAAPIGLPPAAPVRPPGERRHRHQHRQQQRHGQMPQVGQMPPVDERLWPPMHAPGQHPAPPQEDSPRTRSPSPSPAEQSAAEPLRTGSPTGAAPQPVDTRLYDPQQPAGRGLRAIPPQPPAQPMPPPPPPPPGPPPGVLPPAPPHAPPAPPHADNGSMQEAVNDSPDPWFEGADPWGRNGPGRQVVDANTGGATGSTNSFGLSPVAAASSATTVAGPPPGVSGPPLAEEPIECHLDGQDSQHDLEREYEQPWDMDFGRSSPETQPGDAAQADLQTPARATSEAELPAAGGTSSAASSAVAQQDFDTLFPVPEETASLQEESSEIHTSHSHDHLQELTQDDWEEHVDPASGSKYYYNPKTVQSTWTRPTASAQEVGHNAAARSSSNVEERTEHVEPASGRSFHHPAASGAGRGLHRIIPHWEQLPNAGGGRGQALWTNPEPSPEATPAQSSAPASDWTEQIDTATGNTFYVNATTSETSWTLPEAPKTNAATADNDRQDEEPLEECSPPRMEEWLQYTDPATNRRWFFNEATQEHFFEDEAVGQGWKQYTDELGKPWWWHEASDRYFRPRVDSP